MDNLAQDCAFMAKEMEQSAQKSAGESQGYAL